MRGANHANWAMLIGCVFMFVGCDYPGETDSDHLPGEDSPEHTETLQDCPPGMSAATHPERCPSIRGDGLCTHQETAAAEPACSPSAGDGVCSDTEDAKSAPTDCPPKAGDGACTHHENAANAPSDCPPINGDGLCTHDENASTAPADCSPPDYTYTGGGLEALRAVSPDLIFGQLTIKAPIELSRSPSTILIKANSIVTSAGGSFRYEHSGCGTPNAPHLTLVAKESITLGGAIFLDGLTGRATTASATCNSCYGSNGGSVTVSAPRVFIYAPIHTSGGNGSTESDSVGGTYFICGCDAGNGGSVTILADEELVIDNDSFFATFEPYGGSGGHANSNCTPGRPGKGGDLTLVPGNATASVTEREPNASEPNAQLLDFANMRITGEVSVADDKGVTEQYYTVAYLDGTTSDIVEDLYRFRSSSTALRNFRFLLNGSGENDLDLIIFHNRKFFSGATGPGSTHYLDVLEVAYGDEIVVGINRKAGLNVNNDPYELLVTEY